MEIGIIIQHQFSSTLQRMSVITRTLNSDQFEIFCKGSPEMIMSLSKPETGWYFLIVSKYNECKLLFYSAERYTIHLKNVYRKRL